MEYPDGHRGRWPPDATAPLVKHRLSDGDEVFLIGAGGHATVVSDAVRSVGGRVAGYVAPEASPSFDDLPWLGTEEGFLSRRGEGLTYLALSLGDLSLRSRLITLYEEKTGTLFPPIVHARAFVAEDATLGKGAQVMAGAVVQPGARLGAFTIVNTAAVVEHGCSVGPNSHVAPGAILLGNVHVGEEVLVGAGAVVLPTRSVGDGTLIGAGTTVTEDVPAGVLLARGRSRPVRRSF